MTDEQISRVIAEHLGFRTAPGYGSGYCICPKFGFYGAREWPDMINDPAMTMLLQKRLIVQKFNLKSSWCANPQYPEMLAMSLTNQHNRELYNSHFKDVAELGKAVALAYIEAHGLAAQQVRGGIEVKVCTHGVPIALACKHGCREAQPSINCECGARGVHPDHRENCATALRSQLSTLSAEKAAVEEQLREARLRLERFDNYIANAKVIVSSQSRVTAFMLCADLVRETRKDTHD